MRHALAQRAPGEQQHALEVGFDRLEVVFAGVHGAIGMRAGGSQRGCERQILIGVGDVVLLAAVDERVQPAAAR